MHGNAVDTLQQFVTKASDWRTTGETVNVEIVQYNAIFPDGSTVVLTWDPQAIDNGDGTFTGDWIVQA